MAQKDLDAFELIALNEAGRDAGAYFDEIGVGEIFAKVSPGQWINFLKRAQFGEHLRNKLQSNTAPF